jgi:hypothetical protein
MSRLRGLVGALVVAVVLVSGVASAGTGEREVGGWMEQLVERVAAWLGLGSEQPAYRVAVEADGGGSGGVTTMDGGCVDPNGRPKPCGP